MTVLVDMNLSPGWVQALGAHGIDAVHWSSVGSATAPDDEVLGWARDRSFVLLTHDLDFSAILAASGERAPSVVQLRVQDLIADTLILLVTEALSRYGTAIETGALVSLDETGSRVRILPLR